MRVLVCVLFSYLWEHFINKKMKKKNIKFNTKTEKKSSQFSPNQPETYERSAHDYTFFVCRFRPNEHRWCLQGNSRSTHEHRMCIYFIYFYVLFRMIQSFFSYFCIVYVRQLSRLYLRL